MSPNQAPHSSRPSTCGKVRLLHCGRFCGARLLYRGWFSGGAARLHAILGVNLLHPKAPSHLPSCSSVRDSLARCVPVTAPIALKLQGLPAKGTSGWPRVPLLTEFPQLNLPLSVRQHSARATHERLVKRHLGGTSTRSPCEARRSSRIGSCETLAPLHLIPRRARGPFHGSWLRSRAAQEFRAELVARHTVAAVQRAKVAHPGSCFQSRRPERRSRGHQPLGATTASRAPSQISDRPSRPGSRFDPQEFGFLARPLGRHRSAFPFGARGSGLQRSAGSCRRCRNRSRRQQPDEVAAEPFKTSQSNSY